MGQPKTRYAQAGDVNIAYQVVGDGPVDLVWSIGGFSNIDVIWEDPSYAAFLRRLSEFSRLILFDRRGCGLSDRDGDTVTPTLEERMDDLLAVLDAAGSEKASVCGFSEGGSMAALFAATHPERVTSIVLYGTVSRWRKDEDHPWGWADVETLATFAESATKGWGLASDVAVRLWAPSMAGDERFTDWLAKYARQSLSPRAALPAFWSAIDYDLVDVFPTIRVPTLVLHRRDDRLIPVGHGRRIAEQVPGARFVELAGIDHLPFIGDAEEVLAEMEDFLVGSRGTSVGARRLVTVLFTDLAGAIGQLSGLGDEPWRELLAAHDRTVSGHLARFGGNEMKHLGDGFLAAFDGPARAIRCALGIVEGAASLGLSVRVGVHTGECEVVDSDVRGIAVHIGARLVELAEPGEILVSSTVRDLVAGSGLRFGDGRDVELPGVAGLRTVVPVLRHGAGPEAVRRSAIEKADVFRRDGEYWTVGHRGLVVTLRDTKGLRNLARLLAEPRREFHVLDLVTEAGEGGLPMEGRGDPVIDETARTRYKRRITELEEEIEEADQRSDGEAKAAAQEEVDALVAELAGAYGLGGRPRRAPDHVERARKAVSRRLRDAVSRIDRAHPALGRHLAASIRTGVFCSYEPEHDMEWSTQSERADL